jgi:hypothetical protein
MYRLRRVAIVVAGLLGSAAGLLSAAPTAFAMRPAPGDSSGSVAPIQQATVAHPQGTPTWEVALISIGVALVTLIVVAAVVLIRRRFALRPAIH